MDDSSDMLSPTVVLATPPAWRVLDLGVLDDPASTRALIGASFDGLVQESDLLARRLTDLLAPTSADIMFAALSIPGEGGSEDLSTLTVSAPTRHLGESLSIQSSSAAEKADLRTAPPADAGPTATQREEAVVSAVELNTGIAARTERSHVIALGSPLPPMPVYCVEYAVSVPGSERVIVLTFTTIAPSATDTLRAQFADIASTLSFQ